MNQWVKWFRGLAAALLLVALSSIAYADTEPPHLPWIEVYPITWDLFRGVPPADAVHRTEAAAIHMTVSWHAKYSISSSTGTQWIGRVAEIEVQNTMEPTLSWVVPGKALPSVLYHEQLHFDLNEVYRRKLEHQLLATATCSARTQEAAVDLLNTVLHQTADGVLRKLAEMQALYDTETSHSNDPGGQARWAALIAAWLLAPTSAP